MKLPAYSSTRAFLSRGKMKVNIQTFIPCLIDHWPIDILGSCTDNLRTVKKSNAVNIQVMEISAPKSREWRLTCRKRTSAFHPVGMVPLYFSTKMMLHLLSIWVTSRFPSLTRKQTCKIIPAFPSRAVKLVGLTIGKVGVVRREWAIYLVFVVRRWWK